MRITPYCLFLLSAATLTGCPATSDNPSFLVRDAGSHESLDASLPADRADAATTPDGAADGGLDSAADADVTPSEDAGSIQEDAGTQLSCVTEFIEPIVPCQETLADCSNTCLQIIPSGNCYNTWYVDCVSLCSDTLNGVNGFLQLNICQTEDGEEKCATEFSPSTPVTCEQYICGDGVCNGRETFENCPLDCTCGDNICDESESHETCPEDCTCGNSICDQRETYASCPEECALGCGDGICDTSDHGGSFETPETCPYDCTTWCGNSQCEAGEDHDNCPTDCYCGNGFCEETPPDSSPADCSDPFSNSILADAQSVNFGEEVRGYLFNNKRYNYNTAYYTFSLSFGQMVNLSLEALTADAEVQFSIYKKPYFEPDVPELGELIVSNGHSMTDLYLGSGEYNLVIQSLSPYTEYQLNWSGIALNCDQVLEYEIREGFCDNYGQASMNCWGYAYNYSCDTNADSAWQQACLVKSLLPPANNTCEQAELLSSGYQSFMAYTYNATNAFETSNMYGYSSVGPDAFYQFSIVNPAYIEAEYSSSNNSISLLFFSGTCNSSWNQIYDNTRGTYLTPNDYFFVFDSWDANAYGNYSLSFTMADGSSCENALPIPMDQSRQFFNLEKAQAYNPSGKKEYWIKIEPPYNAVEYGGYSFSASVHPISDEESGDFLMTAYTSCAPNTHGVEGDYLMDGGSNLYMGVDATDTVYIKIHSLYANSGDAEVYAGY